MTGGGIDKRCENPCGFYHQLCCNLNQQCGTNSQGQAVCLDQSSGQWQYYTTTYTTTEDQYTTITSVWSTFVPEQTPPPTTTTVSCSQSLGETQCGNTCCGAAYVCRNSECVSGSSEIQTVTATPPVRPTSSEQVTVTQTAVTTETATSTATTTEPFIAPVSTNGESLVGVQAHAVSHLSGGAIAGIVIGVIAGVFVLLLLCLCLCCEGLLDGIMSILGLGDRKRKDTSYVEERYSHHSRGSSRRSRRPQGGLRTWFGTRPSRPQGEGRKSGWDGLATVGVILGALALCLGLKRRRDDEEKGNYTNPSSYYYYSDYTTSASSESSDRRTRESKRSRPPRSRSRR